MHRHEEENRTPDIVAEVILVRHILVVQGSVVLGAVKGEKGLDGHGVQTARDVGGRGEVEDRLFPREHREERPDGHVVAGRGGSSRDGEESGSERPKMRQIHVVTIIVRSSRWRQLVPARYPSGSQPASEAAIIHHPSSLFLQLVLVRTTINSTTMRFILLVLSLLSDSRAFVAPKASRRPAVSLHEAKEETEESPVVDPAAAPIKKKQPEILQPFLPAADPNYLNVGPVGEGSFVLSREGGPTNEELANENVLRIVTSECSDLEVNTLMWKCLGYRFDGSQWTAVECFPNWREKYPTPPDLIGMRRIYSREVDQASLRSNQAIVRSVPVEFKQSLKTHLRPLGFKGYQYSELTPNKTRRAQCANWLIYYREELFGYTVEELRERRRLKKEAEEKAKAAEEWSPPVKEVF